MPQVAIRADNSGKLSQRHSGPPQDGDTGTVHLVGLLETPMMSARSIWRVVPPLAKGTDRGPTSPWNLRAKSIAVRAIAEAPPQMGPSVAIVGRDAAKAFAKPIP
jgi:hypothetical protein